MSNNNTPSYDVADYLKKALPYFPPTEKNTLARQDHIKATPEDYAAVGDYLYFTARTVFLQSHGVIAFFLAQQAIENYLKGLLKHLGNNKMISDHNLEEILKKVKKMTKEPFFHSDECLAIIKCFNPFNQLPRYPVHFTRPYNASYGYIYPDTIYFLDHFVKEYRKLYPTPPGKWNLFKEELPFEMAMFKHSIDPKLIEIFKDKNVNFS
ncbi:MAG TPA: HEPN domain-containing protein [Patescibacteria group bacterium]